MKRFTVEFRDGGADRWFDAEFLSNDGHLVTFERLDANALGPVYVGAVPLELVRAIHVNDVPAT